MRKLNLIVVFNKDLNKVLFCIRAKEPYKGLYNFVGGKVEENETNDEAAYRELFEETGISNSVWIAGHAAPNRESGIPRPI